MGRDGFVHGPLSVFNALFFLSPCCLIGIKARADIATVTEEVPSVKGPLHPPRVPHDLFDGRREATETGGGLRVSLSRRVYLLTPVCVCRRCCERVLIRRWKVGPSGLPHRSLPENFSSQSARTHTNRAGEGAAFCSLEASNNTWP